MQTAYLIAEIVMIPLSGFLGRALSTRYLFAIAAGGFTLFSVMCAGATSIGEMIVWRAAQGFIGGAMIPVVFSAAFTVFPKNRQAMVAAIVGLIATLAPTVGPTIGGYLTNVFSWHWLFLINVVPGIAVTVAVLLLVDFDKPDFALLKRFDFPGLIALAAFLGSLEYVLEEGAANDWFQDRTIVVAAIAPVIGGDRLLRAGADRTRSRSSTSGPSPTATSPPARCSPSPSASGSTAWSISTRCSSPGCAATICWRSATPCSSPAPS